MKRYLLFKGSDYYPSGGWEDFVGSYDTIEEAIAEGDKPDYESEAVKDWQYHWAHIVDTQTMQIVMEHNDDGLERGVSRWEAALRG